MVWLGTMSEYIQPEFSLTTLAINEAVKLSPHQLPASTHCYLHLMQIIYRFSSVYLYEALYSTPD